MTKTANSAGRALVIRAKKSLSETREILKEAMDRILRDEPEIVARGTRLTPASVAKEAGIERSTLYRFHQPIIDEIRQQKAEATATQLRVARGQSQKTEARLKEYRLLVEQAQQEVALLAKINYRLQARIDELEANLRVRDERILVMQRELNSPSVRR